MIQQSDFWGGGRPIFFAVPQKRSGTQFALYNPKQREGRGSGLGYDKVSEETQSVYSAQLDYALVYSVYWWAGLIISVSYFLSQAVIVLFNIAVDFLTRHVTSVKMTDMIRCLDFTERAVLREFVIQRRSVINLPVTEPSVRNLMNAGILTYAYGTPSQADESVIKGMMISLEARPYITYRVLGLSRTHMSEEDVAQIMSERPRFAARQVDRRI